MDEASFNHDLQVLTQDTLRYLAQEQEETRLPSTPSIKIISPSSPPIPFKETEPLPPQPLLKKQEEIKPTQLLEEIHPIVKEDLALHPPTQVTKDLLHDIRSIVMKIAPSIILSCPIPSDDTAKKVKNRWKEKSKIPDVTILASKAESLPFLENVAKAIELHFFPCKVVMLSSLEKNKAFSTFFETPNLKLIIAPDTTVWNCKELMATYHEIPQKKERYLGKTPLLLLPDPSLYLKDPSLKRSLWNLLCQVLRPLK